MEHCKKITSWDIYGVRKFPYRGKRKYNPGIQRTFYGKIVIQNDVFGLTIYQFERQFKACLTRRKEKEQWIINIRFPDKTTAEYLEYLKYGDCTIEGSIFIKDQSLLQAAGTEIEIRERQRMFLIIDQIENLAFQMSKKISSGSLAEGIDLPGSDIDIMRALAAVTVIEDLNLINTFVEENILLMETDTRHPGFCKLKLVAERNFMTRLIRNTLKETEFGLYISTERFMHFCGSSPIVTTTIHGPCISDAYQHYDLAFCLKSKYWPKAASNWIHRKRSGQWPMEEVIDSVVNEGCLFVPIGPKNVWDDTLWRISFSLAEKRLTHSFNYTQSLCYVLLKLTLKNIINKMRNANDLLCSYFLKTTVFWLSEEIPIDTFNINNLSCCFSLCIDKLMSFIRNCYCPNYFIPQTNMFIGKVDESNSQLLLSVLSELRNMDFQIIIESIMGTNFNDHKHYTMNDKNILSLNLDILFYRIASTVVLLDIVRGYKTLHYINVLMKTESSEFMFDVLRYYHADVNQQISQMLVLPERGRERNNIIQRCKKHLMDGTKTDAVSGWLLYASFYYVLGQYKKTIQIVDNVLSRCTPDMIVQARAVFSTEHINNYKQKTESYLTLNHRMRQGTIKDLRFIKHSTLIPQELQLEVQDNDLNLNPLVFAHFLHYLSYTYLHDDNNREHALRNLYLSITAGYYMADNTITTSLVLLGICYEMSGDRVTAYHCYNTALRCDYSVCRSAEKRIKNLFS